MLTIMKEWAGAFGQILIFARFSYNVTFFIT